MKYLKKIIAVIGIICSLPIFLVGCGTAVYKYDRADEYNVGATKLDESEINNLYVNWIDGSVKIIIDSEVETIVIEESSKKVLKDDDYLRYLCEDGTLTIMYRKSDPKKISVSKKKDLVIKLPRETSILKKLNIKTISSDVEINGVNVEESKVETTSGRTEMVNCCVSNTIIETTSGNIKLGGGALFDVNIKSVSGGVYAEQFVNNNMTVDTVSGSTIVCYDGGHPVNVGIKSTSGNVTVKLPESISGFTLNTNTTVGIVSSEFALSINNVYGDGSKKINVTTVSGAINIKKI